MSNRNDSWYFRLVCEYVNNMMLEGRDMCMTRRLLVLLIARWYHRTQTLESALFSLVLSPPNRIVFQRFNVASQSFSKRHNPLAALLRVPSRFMSAMNLSREQQNELLFVGFNQDSGASLSLSLSLSLVSSS